MISGISASLSALAAFRGKMRVASGNVANVNTDEYKKTSATIKEDRNNLPEVETKKVENGGGVVQESDGTRRELSNVDLAEEIPQLVISQRGYEANIKALKAEEDTVGSLLDIIG